MNQLNDTREYETKEQRRKRIKATFESFDADGNGTIELDELVDGLSSFFNIENLNSREIYRKFFKTIFNMCDKSGWFKRKDQKLDLGEFERIANAIPIHLKQDTYHKLMYNDCHQVIRVN